MIALFIKNFGYCLPVCSCLLLKNLFKNNDTFGFYISEQINKLIYDAAPEAAAISSLSSVCSNNICLYLAAISSALLKTF